MGIFINLPIWARAILILVGLGILAGIALLVPSLSPKVLLVLGGGIVGVVLLLVTYALLLKFFEKRKSRVMTSALGKHNAGNSSISDAAQRAKLDDLRQTFEDGVQKFKNAGKDLYSLPWFAVVGEPGSGKTEAIRHSNIGFPPGLQDELQGTGGTINMNWWFTNQAVFLDTAGRLLFEEVVPGSTNEWQEFLRLLKKARPNCPINGMILCIPSDTLIKDTQEELESKSRKLASQLNDIQRALDVRFPVFVLVTKSDLVPGFREFFEGIHDPQLQHQMVGWSNPRALDEPFRPDELEQLLDGYLAELYRRRMALIEDPNPVQIGGRRMDEVDALFTYPSNLQSIFPRLKRYLETLFAAGEWAQKPLFLRGIYFTSSLQEGSALDEELASALDLPMDELPEGRVWEKEKAYFLRDVCKEKVFKEDRLVTRATNAKKQLRQRQMILFWTGIACLLALTTFAYYGAESLKKSVGGQLEYWSFLKEEMEMGDSFVPAAIYEGREAGTYINNTTGSIELEDQLTTVEGYHAKLRELAEQEVEVPGFFKLLFLSGADQESRLKAQRVAFEQYVIEPLLKFTRERMATMSSADWNERATVALETLLKLEKQAADREMGIPPDPLERIYFIHPLMEFLTGEEAGSTLPEVMESTYFASELKDPEAKWPPVWASGGRTLRENETVARAVQTYMEWIEAEEMARLEGTERIVNGFGDFVALEQAEALLLREMARMKDGDDLDDVVAAYEQYREQKAGVDRQIEVLEEIYNGEGGTFSVYESYRDGISRAILNVDAAVEAMTGDFMDSSQALETEGERSGGFESYTLFDEVARILEQKKEAFSNRITRGLTEPELERIRAFDNTYLDLAGLRNEYSYRMRASLYERLIQDFSERAGSPEIELGAMDESLKSLVDLVDGLSDDLEDYNGGLKNDLRASAGRVLSVRSRMTFGEYAQRYRTTAVAMMKAGLGFPLVQGVDARPMTVDAIREIRTRIQSIDADLESDAWDYIPETEQESLKSLGGELAAIQESTRLFLTDSGEPREAVFIFESEPHQREYLKIFYPDEDFNAIFGGRSFRDLSFSGGERIRAYQASNIEMASRPLNAERFSIEFFQLADSTEPEETLTFEGKWSPLEFVLNNRSIRVEPKLGDGFIAGELWHVLLQLPATGEKPLVVVLSVRFPAPLPSRDDWPEQTDYSL